MEIIGRLIVISILLFGACVVGLCFALVAIAVLRIANRRWMRAPLVAALFPPIAAAYVILCLIASSALSGVLNTPDLIFGDIHENLPNSYVLTALDKMPEQGLIRKEGSTSPQVGWVNALQVRGPYVLGSYDYTDDPRTPEESKRNFFLLDTRSGQITNFADKTELARAAGTELNLAPTASFQGTKSVGTRVANWLVVLITIIPPSVAAIWLIFRFVAFLRTSPAPSDLPSTP